MRRLEEHELKNCNAGIAITTLIAGFSCVAGLINIAQSIAAGVMNMNSAKQQAQASKGYNLNATIHEKTRYI